MAKLTSEDFNKKYSELIKDNDDLLLGLMEDFADSSMKEDTEKIESLQKELEDAQLKVKDVTERYKSRFLSSMDDIKEDAPKELEEKEIIDIKEI